MGIDGVQSFRSSDRDVIESNADDFAIFSVSIVDPGILLTVPST